MYRLRGSVSDELFRHVTCMKDLGIDKDGKGGDLTSRRLLAKGYERGGESTSDGQE